MHAGAHSQQTSGQCKGAGACTGPSVRLPCPARRMQPPRGTHCCAAACAWAWRGRMPARLLCLHACVDILMAMPCKRLTSTWPQCMSSSAGSAFRAPGLQLQARNATSGMATAAPTAPACKLSSDRVAPPVSNNVECAGNKVRGSNLALTGRHSTPPPSTLPCC